MTVVGFSSTLKSMLLGSGKHLFLDLEDTIITPNLGGWSSCESMNVEMVKRVIEEFQPDTVNIFSFAIDHQVDLDKFNVEIRRWLEEDVLGCKFNIVPHMEQVKEVLALMKGFSANSITRTDINDFWCKGSAFRDWMKWNQTMHRALNNQLPEITAFFLDDTVETETFCMPHLKLECIIENPENLN